MRPNVDHLERATPSSSPPTIFRLRHGPAVSLAWQLICATRRSRCTCTPPPGGKGHSEGLQGVRKPGARAAGAEGMRRVHRWDNVCRCKVPQGAQQQGQRAEVQRWSSAAKAHVSPCAQRALRARADMSLGCARPPLHFSPLALLLRPLGHLASAHVVPSVHTPHPLRSCGACARLAHPL